MVTALGRNAELAACAMCDLPGWVLAGIAAGRWEVAVTTVLEAASLAVEDHSDSIAASAMDFDTFCGL